MVCKAKEPYVHSHVILPPKMRNLASCVGEQAVKVSDSSCSGSGGSSSSGNNNNNSLSVLDSLVQRSVTSLYHARLSTSKELLIRLTWSKTSTGPTISVSVEGITFRNDESQKLATLNLQLLKKKKGSQSCVHRDTVVALLWDVSCTKFGSGPEPVDNNYYVVVVVDGEFALLLGGWSKDYININSSASSSNGSEFEGGIPTADSKMFGRKEHVVIHSVYSTKARFRDNGKDHEITIRCKGDSWDVKDSELSVYMDKKKVVCEQRLDWNFRGNQIMFVDGSPVDLMWDVYDWWFGGPSGCAVFMFRARSSLESRLWLEEEVLQKEQGPPGFTLLIQASKS
ncbi:hypothetical protein J5N97_012250 [Dioscorea zingiberensis]|uniref:DUF868 family protein n=1 Tax=Dioscorea zingiberensis TaxID=325984 RepID=A0A9D5CNM1_9LILI|nr:hypothetical protein J5N97_012250 [Dioscorea zingiberensis]